MSPKWRADEGWTGDWALPEVLKRPVSDDDREALVALSCVGVGPGRLARELAGADTVSEVASRHEFRWPPSTRIARVRELGARAVVPSDGEYPEELRGIAAPPPLLYVRGERLDRLRPAVAIVGARSCTRGALRFARRLGAELAHAGFVVVSGLARGIDGSAHEGALETGCSVAVLGTGIERIYPAEHRELAEALCGDGALVTEFPPGTTPRRWHFPARNRIIAALSMAVVVVEAGERSGALITAGFALDQGREVYACITGPENPAGAGVREMLRDGARPVVHPEDLVAELRGLAADQGYVLAEPAERTLDGAPPELEGEWRRVYEAVTEETTVDEVAAACGIDPGRAAAVLSGLELDGLLEVDPGGRWSRTS